MRINDVSPAKQEYLIEQLLTQAQTAIHVVFGKNEQEARDLVEKFRKLLNDVPLTDRVFVLHRDALALASDLTGMELGTDSEEQIDKFNKGRQHLFDNPNQLLS
jgi:hypothetical protein